MRQDPKLMLKKAVEIIKNGNSESPILDAELLFIKAMEFKGQMVSRTRVSAGLLMEIPIGVEEKLLEYAIERASGKPVQYIVGEQEFMGFPFHVKQGVLVPRADTEILVESIIELIDIKRRNNGETDKIKILDLCCGTGAIGISLLKLIPNSKAVLLDISEDAFNITVENAIRLGVKDRATILKSDLFSKLGDLKFDIIASNPPYIPTSEIDSLMAGVKDFEPHLALDGGFDGLDFYHKIAENAIKHLEKGGIIAFEIGSNQAKDVKEIMEHEGFVEIEIYNDLAGLNRCVIGTHL